MSGDYPNLLIEEVDVADFVQDRQAVPDVDSPKAEGNDDVEFDPKEHSNLIIEEVDVAKLD